MTVHGEGEIEEDAAAMTGHTMAPPEASSRAADDRTEVELRLLEDDARRSGEFLRDFLRRHAVSGPPADRSEVPDS